MGTAFAPNQVIKGWTEAMQLMVEGDKWEMFIPSGLAYGDGGSPPKIPGHSTLVFKMEIIKIKGTLINGEKFDSSYDRGSPTAFAPNQVIKGWTEAVVRCCSKSLRVCRRVGSRPCVARPSVLACWTLRASDSWTPATANLFSAFFSLSSLMSNMTTYDDLLH